MIEELVSNVLSAVGLKPEEMDTIEFQEIIPGIKPPRVPLAIPGMGNLPLLPGWTVRDQMGSVVNEGIKLPTMGEVAQEQSPTLGMDYYPEGAYYPEEKYQLAPDQIPSEYYYPEEEYQLSPNQIPGEYYYPEEDITSTEAGDTVEPVEPLVLSADPSGSLDDDNLEVEDDDVTLTGEGIMM